MNNIHIYLLHEGEAEMAKLMDIIKKVMIFKEPEKIEKFILKEAENEGEQSESSNDNKNAEEDKNKDSEDEYKNNNIGSSLDENVKLMKKVYSIPLSSDVVLREFDIAAKNNVYHAFIIFIDGMVDRAIINEFILQPLMLLSNMEIANNTEGLIAYVKNHILPQGQLTMASEIKKIVGQINFGGCAIFIDGLDSVIIADVKGWEHRGIEKPNNELVLRGPQEGFNEVLRANTALVRKFLLDENLVIENLTVGKRSRTPCAVLYIKDIANDSLVNEVKRRINGIKVNYVLNSGELEQLIEDSTFLPSPQIMSTERPDKTAGSLIDGKVAVIVNNSPNSLIMPVTFTALMQSPEDYFSRFPYGSFMRIIRLIGISLGLLLPGLYVAVTNFHQEMIPTDLLMSIESARERVPFPSVFEILLMEVSFDLIREAGIRIPGPIGPTLGIIGALILGQAAVAANIVSPILIIIVALTGIGGYTTPDYSLAFTIRILRYAYIALGALAGLLGITTGVFIQGLLIVSTKSFGVPFFAPFGPVTSKKLADALLKAPIWKQDRTSDFINAKKTYRQEEKSKTWKESKEEADMGGKQNNDR